MTALSRVPHCLVLLGSLSAFLVFDAATTNGAAAADECRLVQPPLVAAQANRSVSGPTRQAKIDQHLSNARGGIALAILCVRAVVVIGALAMLAYAASAVWNGLAISKDTRLTGSAACAIAAVLVSVAIGLVVFAVLILPGLLALDVANRRNGCPNGDGLSQNPWTVRRPIKRPSVGMAVAGKACRLTRVGRPYRPHLGIKGVADIGGRYQKPLVSCRVPSW